MPIERARTLSPPDERDGPNDVLREFRGASFQRVAGTGKAYPLAKRSCPRLMTMPMALILWLFYKRFSAVAQSNRYRFYSEY